MMALTQVNLLNYVEKVFSINDTVLIHKVFSLQIFAKKADFLLAKYSFIFTGSMD